MPRCDEEYISNVVWPSHQMFPHYVSYYVRSSQVVKVFCREHSLVMNGAEPCQYVHGDSSSYRCCIRCSRLIIPPIVPMQPNTKPQSSKIVMPTLFGRINGAGILSQPVKGMHANDTLVRCWECARCVESII